MGTCDAFGRSVHVLGAGLAEVQRQRSYEFLCQFELSCEGNKCVVVYWGKGMTKFPTLL